VASANIPAPTVGRLPTYLRAAVWLAAEGLEHVASDQFAARVGISAATVRRDLSALGIRGTRGVGYDVKYLVYEFSVELGVDQQWPVAVVGAGNLGKALANYTGMADRGFPIVALFDIDPKLVGARVGDIEVSHLDEMGRVVADRQIAVGVIATVAEGAQRSADALVEAGVSSILNFTTHRIQVAEGVVVRRVDLATELQILSFYRQREQGAASGAGLPLGHSRAADGSYR